MKLSFKENFTVPNVLTVIRLLLIPPMMLFLLDQNYIMAGLMLLLSALSDMLDGLTARKLNQITALGKILDPIADKLTLIAVVACVNILYPDIFVFTAVLFAKEVLMLSGGAFLLRRKIKPPAAKWYGKMSTVIFYSSVITLVLLKAIWGYTNKTLTFCLLAVTTASMLFSLVMYFLLFLGLARKYRAEKAANGAENTCSEADKDEDI